MRDVESWSRKIFAERQTNLNLILTLTHASFGKLVYPRVSSSSTTHAHTQTAAIMRSNKVRFHDERTTQNIAPDSSADDYLILKARGRKIEG